MAVSGWCLDMMHLSCLEWYHNKFGRPCTCKCHEEGETK